jgi:hypothetical protein
LFRGSSEPIDLPPYSRRHLINYLAQVLSAFKAASADDFGRVSSTDNLHAAASHRLGLDDLTFQGRGILSQVERWRRLANSLGGFSREGAVNATMATVAERSFFMVSPIVVRPTSDKRQTRSAGRSSLPTARNKVEQIDPHQRQIQSLRVPMISRGRESRSYGCVIVVTKPIRPMRKRQPSHLMQ